MTYDDVVPAPGGLTPAVRWLISANVVVYLIQLTLLGQSTVTDWLALSANDFPAQWWTVGTYMFVHGGFVHIALNMVTLWMFGPRVESQLGTKSFAYFYLWCGLGGAIFHLLLARQGSVIGASGAVLGVVLAYALKWPEDDVYLFGAVPMRARWLAVWMIVWNVGMALIDMSGVSNGNTAWMTHVGGLAFAWIALNAPTSSSLDRIRRYVATVPDEPDLPRIPKAPRQGRIAQSEPPSSIADDVVARSNAIISDRFPSVSQMPPIPNGNDNNSKKKPNHPPKPEDRRKSDAVDPAKDAKERLETANRLLDKISRHGLSSLTSAERAMLEEISRDL